MAQAGYTPISLYYSTTAAAVPTAGNLVAGELAINIVDGKLYYENSSGVVTLLAGAGGAGIVAGSNTQIQFNNSGVFGASANLTWNGTSLSATQIDITAQGTLRLQDTTGGEYVGLRAPGTLGASYTLTWPADDGTSGQALITDGSGVLSWSTAASGDVYGPASSTDNAVARFDSTTGKLLQNSVVLIGDTGAVTGVTDLSASGSVTLSGGTANGVTYLNGSKVLTSGSALTFDGSNLVNGGNFSTNTSGLATYFRASGTAYTQIGDNQTLGAGTAFVIGSSSAYLAGVVAGSEGMRLTSTGLGIGTSSPATKLNVSQAGGPTLRLTNSDTNSTTGDLIGALDLFSADADGASVRAYIRGYILDGAGRDGYLTFATSTTSGTATERMRLDTSGNLGLGVTPSAWGGSFVVTQYKGGSVGSQNANYLYSIQNAYFDGTNYKYISTAQATLTEQNSGVHKWYNAPSGTAGTNVTFTQAMTLDASGNLGIGTTSPAFKLEVKQTGSTTAQFERTDGVYSISLKGTGTTANGALGMATNDMVLLTNGSERLRLDSSGNLGLGSGAISGWANSRVFQTDPTFSAISTDTASDGNFSLSWNAYATAADTWKYRNTGLTANRYRIAQGTFQWYTAASGTAGDTISFTQSLAVGKGTSLALEGATSQSGTGITFPATQLASSDANTLDDYEEGTWTPSFTFLTAGDFSATYSQQVGTYTRIGNRVTVNCTIVSTAFTFTTASSSFRVLGLPFTSEGTSGNQSHGALATTGVTYTSGYTMVVSNIPPSTAFIAFTQSSTAAALGGLTVANFVSGTNVTIRTSITYQV